MISKHYNINQLRIDLWNDLKEQSKQITRYQKDKSFDKRLQDLNAILENLLSIEHYFSFPGAVFTKEIIVAVTKEEFNAVSNRVTEVVALLVSDDYRTHPELRPDHFDKSDKGSQKKSMDIKGNSFEVLYVENLSQHEEKLLKKKSKEHISAK